MAAASKAMMTMTKSAIMMALPRWPAYWWGAA